MKPTTEAQFARQVEDLARAYGYRWVHHWISVRSTPGWPDYVFWHPERRRVFAAELKGTHGRLSAPQRQVTAELAVCGLPCFVWYPSDLEMVRRVLAGEDAP